MPSEPNPFTPSFGISPPILSGRAGVLGRVEAALAHGPRHPDFTMLATGSRGIGKTVLLNAVEEAAGRRGWAAIPASAASAADGMTLSSYIEWCAEKWPVPPQWHQAGAGIGSLAKPDGRVWPGLVGALMALARLAAANGAGVLLTIDELHSAAVDDFRAVAYAIQQVTRREQLPLAFVGAGLNEMEDTILADDGMTFFQRCARAPLSPLSEAEARFAIEQPILNSQRRIEAAGLDAMVLAASGNPFMVQAVGFAAWEHAGEATMITAAHTDAGIADAERSLISQIVMPMWRRISSRDREFLYAMSADDDASAVRALTERMGITPNFANRCRQRLIDAGAIVAAGRGLVRFSHEAMRDWLRDGADDPFDKEPDPKVTPDG